MENLSHKKLNGFSRITLAPKIEILKFIKILKKLLMREHNKAYRSSEIFNYYSSNRNKWFDFYKSERTIIEKLKNKKKFKKF